MVEIEDANHTEAYCVVWRHQYWFFDQLRLYILVTQMKKMRW